MCFLLDGFVVVLCSKIRNNKKKNNFREFPILNSQVESSKN